MQQGSCDSSENMGSTHKGERECVQVSRGEDGVDSDKKHNLKGQREGGGVSRSDRTDLRVQRADRRTLWPPGQI